MELVKFTFKRVTWDKTALKFTKTWSSSHQEQQLDFFHEECVRPPEEDKTSTPLLTKSAIGR